MLSYNLNHILTQILYTEKHTFYALRIYEHFWIIIYMHQNIKNAVSFLYVGIMTSPPLIIFIIHKPS